MTAVENREQRFGHYDVERVLGRGSMGVVYLARDRRIGRRVALKTITLTPQQFDDSTSPKEFHSRLQREAEVSGSLQHPNIVTLYEAGYEDERISYLAMEYVEGETLLALIKAAAPAPIDFHSALALIEDVLRGLAYAHAAGIIHRDIKPANILVTSEGRAKVADFGIARRKNSSMTAAGALMGTPNYMSPEQVLGQALTPKADVFSTGVLFFEMLTGIKPFVAGDVTEILHNILRQRVPHVSDLNPAVPKKVGDVVERMIAKSPEERLNAADALAEIENVEIPSPGSGEPLTPASRILNRLPTLVIAVAAAVLLGGLLLIAIAMTRSAARPTVQISPAQLREFDDKRRALEQAQNSLLAGRYQESIDRYDAYLAKYPASQAAFEGREIAVEALDRQTNDEQKAAKTPKRRKRSRSDEDISPAELLNRIKKVFKPH
ncbi:MAG: serine/threonine-protein kinase [Thermoanaerobaculia bacterium]